MRTNGFCAGVDVVATKLGIIGEYWRVLESTGEYWRVLESTGLKSTGKYWKVLESTGKYRRVLESTEEYWRVLESIVKYLGVLGNTGVLESTGILYQEIQCQYIRVSMFNKYITNSIHYQWVPNHSIV